MGTKRPQEPPDLPTSHLGEVDQGCPGPLRNIRHPYLLPYEPILSRPSDVVAEGDASAEIQQTFDDRFHIGRM